MIRAVLLGGMVDVDNGITKKMHIEAKVSQRARAHGASAAAQQRQD
jgi:hypothetical protein